METATIIPCPERKKGCKSSAHHAGRKPRNTNVANEHNRGASKSRKARDFTEAFFRNIYDNGKMKAGSYDDVW